MHTATIHRTLRIARNEGAESRTFSFRCSTATEDSQGRIVAQDWDLERYLANPVVLWNHGMGGGIFGGTSDTDVSLPIGRASNVGLDGGELRADITLVTAEANPLAEKVYQGILQGSINGVSVGWRASEAQLVEVDGGETIVLSGNELYEISVVAIPANADAVRLAASFRAAAWRAAERTRAGEGERMVADIRREFADYRKATDARIEALASDLRVMEETSKRLASHAHAVQLETFKAFARAGKTYGQMSTQEKHELYHRDRELFERMRAAHQERNQ